MPRYPHVVVVALVAASLCACTSSTTGRSTPTPTASTTSAAAIALVFDTGSNAGHTAEILDTLRREGVRATFIVTGLWAEQHRDLMLAITASGHEVINGTYHGTSFTGASTGTPPQTSEERALELSRTEVTVYHLTGRSTRPYWYPPHGDIDAGARRDAAAAGYTTAVMATLDTAGSPGASTDDIVARTVAAAAPNAIEIMYGGSESPDAAALPRVIAALRAKGLAFAAVEDILPHPQ
jgi:peptidoglycan-N-acetylglucosamine deacetylase